MSTDMTWEIDSSSSADTLEIGERFGRNCRGGEVFVLVSDLGGGKTTFTKGLAKGLGCTETVGSPSFTINRIYKCRDGRELYHFDFYRLGEAGLVGQELREALEDTRSIIVVEWADVVKEVLPDRSVIVELERVGGAEDARHIKVTYPKMLDYVLGEGR